MANYTYLTKSGYDKLVAELDELKTTERQKSSGGHCRSQRER